MNFKKKPQVEEDLIEEEPEDILEPEEEPEEEFNQGIDEFGLGDGFDSYPTPMEKHSSLLKSMVDFQEYLKLLQNNWLAIVWNEKEKKYIRDTSLTPILNEAGANWCTSFIKTYVRKNNILSHLGKQEYEDLITDINRTLYLSLGTRYKEFGFTCYSDVIRVWNEVENASILALSGAGGGKYSGFLAGREGGVMTHQERSPITEPNIQQKKPKWYKKWLGFGN